MNQFNAAHLEIKKTFHEDFQTEPHEAGWAKECIFFLMVEDIDGKDPVLDAEVQISHDGISWVAEGTAFAPVRTPGLHFVKVREFGNWLRLSCRIRGKSPSFRLLIQIALKS